MDNKIAKMVCGVVVAILLITTLAIPVIAENGNYTRQEKFSLNNEGIPLVEGDVTAEYIMKWDNNLPQFLSVNGATTTVYFVAGDDATVSPSSKDVTVDLTYGELPVPVRTGYTFDGWYTSTSYTTEITEDSIVTGTADKILYAKWVGNTYTITFDADGGTVLPATKDVVFGSAYGELPVPIYTGHIFGGWFNEDNEVITASNIVDVADDQTLTAVWSLDQYTVSFTTDNHGTVDVQSLTAYYGTAYTISGNTITIGSTTITATADSGWVFDHWTPSTSGTIEGSMTFMANFNQPPVTLTFNTDGVGSVDVPSIADVPRGTQYVVSDNTVTVVGFSTVTASLPNGYYMIGWNVEQGTGTVNDVMTFTAQYELIEIAKVVCSDNTTWIITEDGKLFGCGSNQYGQQGDGTTTDVTTFTQRLDTETIASVSCSNNTTWAITTDSKLFGCGYNSGGQQGNGTSGNGTDVLTFTQRLNTETIASVSCSNNTTWAVTTDGKLFGCGNGYNGKQGNGSSTNVTTFTQRLDTETIASVSCSFQTTWAVTTDGKLFGCGQGSNYGQQGNGILLNVSTFTQRLDTETIADVVCSDDTTWATTTDGKLFGCGNNQYGQQGDGSTTNITTFTQRLDTETIAKIVCSKQTTWAITTDSKLFGCGSNQYGQQGDGTTTDVTTFTQRLDTETIASVSCSNNTTWAVTTDGKLFGCGYNDSGQQGSGNTAWAKTFTQRLTNENVASTSCSDNTTWVVTTDGKLFGCGSNQYGQQGDGTNLNVLTFTQRGAEGSVNIQLAQVTPILNPPIHLNPNIPFNPSIILGVVTASDIIGTDYTWLAGGLDWMLCTVTIGEGQYGIALYYAGLTEPLIWDEDVTFEFSNGTMSVVNNGTTYTMDYTSIYYRGNGQYVLTQGSAYVLESTSLIGYAIPTVDSAIEVYYISGTADAITIADGSIVLGEGYVVSQETDYEEITEITEIGATFDTDSTAICDSLIAPKNVTITRYVEDNTLKDLMNIVPILLVIGVFMFVAGFVLYRRF